MKFEKSRRRVNNVTISFVLMNSFYYSTLVHELTNHFRIDLRKKKQATHIFEGHAPETSFSYLKTDLHKTQLENWIADRSRLTGCLKTKRPLCEVVLRYTFIHLYIYSFIHLYIYTFIPL
jgi:hypothetical protein